MSGEEELKMGHVVWVGQDEEAEHGLDAWWEKLILSVQEFLRLGGLQDILANSVLARGVGGLQASSGTIRSACEGYGVSEESRKVGGGVVNVVHDNASCMRERGSMNSTKTKNESSGRGRWNESSWRGKGNESRRRGRKSYSGRGRRNESGEGAEVMRAGWTEVTRAAKVMGSVGGAEGMRAAKVMGSVGASRGGMICESKLEAREGQTHDSPLPIFNLPSGAIMGIPLHYPIQDGGCKVRPGFELWNARRGTQMPAGTSCGGDLNSDLKSD
ncbi:hypothetical protein EDD22DRAFT_848807 [Suillus occidentalis]|nr:hypothetical protein EDD22DRAFT_848807 [Suillus occidentalis]